MKTCDTCLTAKPAAEFYAQPNRRDGLTGCCRDCTCTRVRANYAANRPAKQEYERRRNQRPERKDALTASLKRQALAHPERRRARIAVGNAARDGRLKKLPCHRCGTTARVQAHHHDYSKPLDVEWLCFACHREHAHAQHVNERMKLRAA
jgi:hypothetical protein